MRRYKLLKDTPTIKAGTVFEERVSDFDQLKELVRITPIGAKTSPQWTIEDIDNFNEWFKEVKEFKGWKPRLGQEYKCLDEFGEVSESIREYNCDMSDLHVSTGNCYPIDTPDELIIKEQKLIPQALRRLKTAAKKAWFEFNGSDSPDWNDETQDKCFIEFSHESNKFYVDVVGFHQSLGQVYFPTKESAQYVIDNMQDELKLVMGIE